MNMNNLSQDPIINVIHNGIKQGIRITFEKKLYGATIILVLSGIDTMDYLDMPGNQEDVEKKDFIDWVKKYIRFPCKEQLAGIDLYGARCGMLHSYSIQSKLSRQNRCRQIGYMNKGKPEVRYNPEVTKDLVMVSIEALVESFFKGIDQFLINLFSNPKKSKIAEERLKKIVMTVPYKEQIVPRENGNGNRDGS
ncbi:hypothetical protein KJ633_03740 [bacterium]|nr:hypothetical protein [bacterium]MBU3955551.1 hypothetical protein [bacterium]